MKSDRHIVDRQEQIQEGSEVKTRCGLVIKKARIHPMSEADWVPGTKENETPAKGVCMKCQRKLYQYLVSEGE